MKKNKMMMTRRQILKAGMISGAGLVLMPGGVFRKMAFAEVAMDGLSDPAAQPKFVNLVPDALSPGALHRTEYVVWKKVHRLLTPKYI